MADGQSWQILDALRDDLRTYMEANASNGERFLFEVANKPVSVLLSDAEKGRVTDFHIGIYENPPEDLVIVGGGKNLDEQQPYEIRIFKTITKNGHYDEDAERRLLNVRDLAFDWIQQTNDSGGTNLKTITSGALLNLAFDGITEFDRQERYIVTALGMIGFRNKTT